MMENLILRTTQINLLDCNHSLMVNTEEMEIFLYKLVKFISMTLIGEELTDNSNPHAFLYNPPDKNEIDHGVTGIAILVESHVAAHAWPKRNLLNVVITSCKEYDARITALWISGYCESKIFKFETMSF
jgi:S-adenosylmethionine/arginine decarboxylase-like enzyme